MVPPFGVYGRKLVDKKNIRHVRVKAYHLLCVGLSEDRLPAICAAAANLGL